MNRPECAHLARAALAAACAIIAAHAPLCAAQPKDPPLFQVEVIAFAYNDASPSEELFPRQSVAEASSDLGVESAPLREFDFGAALEIEPPALDPSAGAAAPSSAAPGAGSPSGAAAGGAGSAGGAASGDASGGAAPADAQTPGLSAPTPEPLIGAQGFRVLGPESYKLGAAYAKIERLPAYRPLLHAAWIQPALPENQAKTITTAELGALNPEGGVQLYASRYLHFTVDLRYRPTAEQRAALSAIAPPPAADDPIANPQTPPASSSPTLPGPSEAPSPSSGAPQSGQYGVDPLDEISLGPRLTMKASRRVAANEVQYFDHPYFGLLVLVTPYEPEAPTGAQDGVAPVP